MSQDNKPSKVKISTTTGNTATNIFLRNRGYIQDILYIPESAAAIPIPLKSESKKHAGKHQNTIAEAYDRLTQEASILSKRAEELVQAKVKLSKNGDVQSVIKAQSAMRMSLHQISTQGDLEADGNNTYENEPPLKASEPKLIEVYSLEKREMMMIARETLAKCETRNVDKDNIFYVYQSEESEETQKSKKSRKETVTQRPNLTAKDAFKFFRPVKAATPITGELDIEIIKKAWDPVKKQIAAEWNLGSVKKEGRIPSRLLAKSISPIIANFFDKEDYAAVDALVEQVNESAKGKWNKHEENRKILVDSLSKKGFSPDDWEKVQIKVRDIWWSEWRASGENSQPQNEHEEFADAISIIRFNKGASFLKEMQKKLANQPLPPVMWDASAGAQLMRYSAGASGKAEFNLLETGRLAVSGKAEAKFNLVEGKADVGFYLPDSNGQDLIFKLPIRTLEGTWAPLMINGRPQHFFGDLAHFEFDKSIVSPRGIFELSNVFTGWEAASRSVQNLKLTPTSEPMVVQVVGHTDAVGSDGYNARLSNRRARAACALLNNSATEWLCFFDEGIWGEYELKLMLFYILCKHEWRLNLDWKSLESHQDFYQQLKQRSSNGQNILLDRPKVSFSHEHQSYKNALKALRTENIAQLITRFQKLASRPEVSGRLFNMPVTEDGQWRTNTPNGYNTVDILTQAYFHAVKSEIKTNLPNATFTDSISFHTDQTIGLGETQLQENTRSRSRKNRRIELIAWAKTNEIDRTKLEDYNFGAVRVHFSGAISGEAGVNLNLSANIGFDVDKRLLLAAGTIAAATGQDVKVGRSAPDAIHQNTAEYEATVEQKGEQSKKQKDLAAFNAEAGAKGGAFAGAKAEANIKAAIDWRPPIENHKEKTAMLAANQQIHSFLTLGDVGYMATAMAGIGLEGEFKIGFDRETKRFQIKVSAKATLGLGFGGGFSFSVAINHLFDFIKLVYKKLSDNDFHFIDVFESRTSGSEVDVYELFCAISFELLKQGKPLQAGTTYAAGNALDLAIDMLQSFDKTTEAWVQAKTTEININQVLETINSKPDQLRYLTPEIKGRLLFLLVEAKLQRRNQGLLSRLPTLVLDIFDGDLDDDVEEAALTLIEQGISSNRDWQKTLQNMLSIDAKGNMCAPSGCDDNITDKVTLAIANQNYLQRYLLNEEKDREALANILKSKNISLNR